MIHWCSRNRGLAALLATAYSVVVIAGHGAFSVIANWVSDTLSRELFNTIITVLLLSVIVLAGSGLRRHWQTLRHDRCGLLLMAGTLLMVVVAYNTLLVTNVESIHFLQYALLTIPLFALSRSYGTTVLWTTLIGVVDETWQYVWIYGNRADVYFDFNDIILNMLGAGIGVTLLYLAAAVHGGQGGPTGTLAIKSPRLWLPLACAALLALTIMAGLVQVYPAAAEGKALLLSRAAAPETFWTQLPWGKTYHVLHPFEGLLLVQGLLLFYSLLDSGRGWESGIGIRESGIVNRES